jgi:flagellar hook-associated protein 3 FlgL
VDYAEAITRLTREQSYLEAAQKSFLKVSGLSLFNYV